MPPQLVIIVENSVYAGNSLELNLPKCKND